MADIQRQGADRGPGARESESAHTARLAQAGRLLAGVVHEIKNPLAVIQGYAQLLHDKCRDPEDRADLQAIIDETRRVGALVEDMLAFTRKVPERAEQVDLSRVVTSSLNLSRHSMSQASISVVASLPDDPLLVAGHHGAYVQVLLNLLENGRQSLEAGRPGGRGIALRVESGPSEVALIVANNGPPIAPEMRERIFEPFFTTKGPGAGNGLGLAVCRDILERYGGSIRVEDGPPDGGAAFRVEFCRADS